MALIFGFDIATRCTGWCVGDGSRKPAVGHFRYDQVGADIAKLAVEWERDLNILLERFGRPDVVVYEAPIKTPHDKLLTLRKIYGMGYGLERWCGRRHIHVVEEDLRKIKKRIAGKFDASKDDMVDVVRRRLGITLSPGDERKDEADAVGAWLTGGVDHYAREHQPRWDAMLHGSKGALI